jgi:hypothetical protein
MMAHWGTKDGSSKWNCIFGSKAGKHRSIRVIGNQIVGAIDRCLTRIPLMTADVLGNICEMICVLRFLHGGETWGVSGGWEIVDTVCGRFCKKVFRTARSTTSRAAERKL